MTAAERRPPGDHLVWPRSDTDDLLGPAFVRPAAPRTGREGDIGDPRRDHRQLSAAPTSFMIEPVPPFRLDLTAWALRRRPGNIVDRWDGVAYRRAVKLDGIVAEVEVRQAGPPEAARLDVSVTTGAPIERTRAQAEVTATLARVLGFDLDLDEFYRRTRHDPHLGPLADRYRGLKPPRFPTMFESLANAIACQQLTLTVGIVLLNRLAESFGPIGTMPSRADVHAFPDAADLISGTPAGLRRLGLSTRKAEYLLELARGVADGDFDLEALSNSDDDTVSASLQELRGIGRWSAEYALLRGLGRLGVFPGDDVGARNNLARRLGLERPVDYEGAQRAVARWAPYAGLAYFHLLLERIDDAGWLGVRVEQPRIDDASGNSV
jgi:DNA-3-methyladenine glycosylase II